MSAAQAYLRHPTASVGLLTESLFDPLPCTGASVEAVFHGSMCRVSIKSEHRNTTSSSQAVMGAFFVPDGWTFIGARADGGGRYVLSTIRPDSGAVAHYNLKEGFAAQRAALSIPWKVLVGETVVLTSTFLCPVDGTTFSLPKALFPKPGLDTPASEFRSRFTIQAPCKMAEGSLSVQASGTLNAPLLDAPSLGGGVRADSSLIDNGQGFSTNFSVPIAEADTFTFNFIRKSRAVGYGASALDIDVVEETNVEEVGPTATRALALTIWPDFSAEQHFEPNAEVYFILGVGNGATKTDLTAVQDAVRVALHGLPSSCNVNAVCCTGGSAADDAWLFSGDGTSSIPISPDHFGMGGPVDQFIKRIELFSHVSPASQNFAPEPMSRPVAILRDLVTAPYVEGLSRNIILITTDGGDRQSAETSQLLSANVHSTSVCTLALNVCGSADVANLSNLAAVSGGQCEVVTSAATVTESLASLVASAVVPSITHASVRIAGPDGADLIANKTYTLCGCGPTTVPIVRAGRQPVVVYALGFGDAPTQLTVTIDGLVGVHRLQQVLDVPNLAEASTNTCVKDDPTTYSLLHQQCAMKMVQHAIATGNLSVLRDSGTPAALAVPSPYSVFGTRDNAGSTQSALAYAPPPLRRTIGRGAPIAPLAQKGSTSCISATPSPLPSIAASTALQQRILRADDARYEAAKAVREAAYEANVRKGRAQGQEDSEENTLDDERVQIDGLRNETAASLLPAAQLPTQTTYAYLRTVIEGLVASVQGSVGPTSVLTCQALDGSFAPSSPVVVNCIGLSPQQVQGAMPSSLGGGDEAATVWATALVISRLENVPAGVLAVRKGRAFLSKVPNVDAVVEAAKGLLSQ